MSNSISKDRTTLFILLALLIVVGVTQAQNMFGFPYYHDDEGTYIANSLALNTDGQLSPYTYSYDVPPAGTMLMSAWMALSGSIEAFGFPLNLGRVLMLAVHVITTGLLFLTAKKLTRRNLAAVIAALVFAFSPLTTSTQRLIAPDNLMVMWLMLSVYLVLGDNRTLVHYVLSAFAFGIAVLTKGSAVYFALAMIYIILRTSDKHHRRFAISLWLTIAILLVMFYPLYAMMKEELFPEGSWLGGDFPHVSLLEQLGDRGPDTGRFLNYGSGLSDAFKEWVSLAKPDTDPVLIYGGLISAAFVFIFSLDNRNLRALVALLLAAAFQMLFGGPVYKIEAILLLPWLALSVGVFIVKLLEIIGQSSTDSGWKLIFQIGILAVVLYPFWAYDASRIDVYTVDQVEGQLEATEWARTYLPADAVIVTDNYAFVELRQTHPNTHSYWRVDTDPAVKFNILGDDICNIDYIITTQQIYQDVNSFGLDLMRRALTDSDVLVSYSNNGWPTEIRQVRKTFCEPHLTLETITN